MQNFVHLHCHTAFSLLDGAARIDEMVRRAVELNMPAIAITDHGVMYGAIDFYKVAQKYKINPIIGCEVYVAPGSRFSKNPVEGESYYHLILLAETDEGYRNLVKLVSLGHTEGFYYKPRVDKELLRQYHHGLICLSACIAGEIPQKIIKGDVPAAEQLVREYIDIFGKVNFFLEIQDHGLPEEKMVNAQLARFAQQYQIGLVATNDSHYTHKKDAAAQDVLLCIQTGKTVDDNQRMRFPNDEFYLKSAEEMLQLFPNYPEAIDNTVKIAERCRVNFEFGKLLLPEFPVPDGFTDESYLRMLCEQALPQRYTTVTDEVLARLDYEFKVIKQMGYCSYFLIVWDFVNYAKQQHIPVGPGRGSAAGSIVSYLLGITNIDPLKYGLLFERFLNPERVSMPDIDIDFCYELRGEIINYVVSRYGVDKVAQIITFGTMAAKAAVRDVGRALNMSYSEVDRIAKLIPNELGITLERALQISSELQQSYAQDDTVHKLIELAKAVEGLPRHASTHAAGVVIANHPLTDYVPLQYSSEGFVTTQYDKDRIEEIGLLKMDLLGLRTLTVIGNAIKNIQVSRGIELDIEMIPLDDVRTCEMLTRGDTQGVFQMESGGMTNLVKELKPESFADLIPLVALYRPGPLGTGMVSDFIDGRHGRKQNHHLHPLLQPVLQDTFGVILYQEQVMQIASVMAGFSLGQADILRRAMGKKKPEVLAAQKENFVKGAVQREIDVRAAQETFDLMAHFAGYGFNKSHSAAYALVAYQTAYLKAHFPAEFMAALLTSVMDTNEKVGYYIEQLKRMGLKILPPDINYSMASFTVSEGAIRFGLAAVKNVGENAIQSIVNARSDGAFSSLVDFCSRVDMRTVNKRVIESLIKCGAFDSLGYKRSQLLATLDQAVDAAACSQRDKASGQIGLFCDEAAAVFDVRVPDIEEAPVERLIAWEKEIIGFYVTAHPLDKFREKMDKLIPINQVLQDGTDGKLIKLGGLITNIKRITTKNGQMMCFLSVEDYAGQVEVIVFPKTYERVQHMLIAELPVVVCGKVSTSEDGTKILTDDIFSLATYVPQVRLAINREQETTAIFDRLKQIFAQFPGESTVFLHLTQSRRIIKCEKQYWLDPSPQAITALEELLGRQSVTVM